MYTLVATLRNVAEPFLTLRDLYTLVATLRKVAEPFLTVRDLYKAAVNLRMVYMLFLALEKVIPDLDSIVLCTAVEWCTWLS